MSCRSCKDRSGPSFVKGTAGLLRSHLNIGITDDKTITDRRAACEACDRWDHGRCNECGCYTFSKTRLRSEKCPLGNWPDA